MKQVKVKMTAVKQARRGNDDGSPWTEMLPVLYTEQHVRTTGLSWMIPRGQGDTNKQSKVVIMVVVGRQKKIRTRRFCPKVVPIRPSLRITATTIRTDQPAGHQPQQQHPLSRHRSRRNSPILRFLLLPFKCRSDDRYLALQCFPIPSCSCPHRLRPQRLLPPATTTTNDKNNDNIPSTTSTNASSCLGCEHQQQQQQQ
jgi:hypothetical protein